MKRRAIISKVLMLLIFSVAVAFAQRAASTSTGDVLELIDWEHTTWSTYTDPFGESYGTSVDIEVSSIKLFGVGAVPDVPRPVNDSLNVNEGETRNATLPQSLPSEINGWYADRFRLMHNGIMIDPGTETSIQHGWVTLNENGTYTYRHDGSEGTFTDHFNYVVRYSGGDGSWSPVSARISITINPRNDNAPVINWALDTVSFGKNMGTSLTVIAHNDGAHAGTRITDVDVNTQGTLILGEVVRIEYSNTAFGTITPVISSDRKSVSITHSGQIPFGSVLNAKIVVEIRDTILYGQPEDSDPANGHINVIHAILDTIFVKVLPSNDNPPDTLSTPIYYLPENGNVSGNLRDFIYSPDGFPLEFGLFAQAIHGNVVVSMDGSFMYTRRGVGIEIFTDTFTVLVSNGTHTVTFEVVLRIYPRNDEKPVVVDGMYIREYAIDEDRVLTVDSANGIISWIDDADRYPVFDGNWNYNNEAASTLKDVFVIRVIDANVVNLPENGYGTNSGVFVIRPDGSFGYTPGNGFTGRDSIKLVVRDFAPANLSHGGSGEEGEGTDPIWIVIAINELPFPRPDMVEVREGATYSVNVITNDYNPNPARWALTATEIVGLGTEGETQYGRFTLVNNVFTFTSDPSKLTGAQPFYTETLQYRMLATPTNGTPFHVDTTITITIWANSPSVIDGSFYEDTFAQGIVNRVTIPFNTEIDVNNTNFAVDFNGNVPISNRILSNDRRTVFLMLDTAGRNIATDGLMKVTIEFDERFENTPPAEIFPLDSAAPVVTSARYIRAPGGKDTLILAMSEQSDIAIGGGNAPFKFVRGSDNSLYEILFDDRSLLGVTDGYFMYRMVIASPDSAKILAGDSVFVNWEATTIVGDNMGNRQRNPENRRVPIDREISTSILSATYFSRSNPANGYIDLIRVELGTPITLEVAKKVAEVLVLSPSRNFTRDAANVTLTDARTGFYLPVTERRREATISSGGVNYTYSNPKTDLFADDSVKILTPVIFDLLTVRGGTRATDSVAPVILYAEYILGEGARNNLLNVVFSEAVAARDENPYKFLQRGTNNEYGMAFRDGNRHTSPSPHILRYLVDSVTIAFPLSHDSIWIATANGVVRDTGNIIQNNTTVRAPLVVVGEYPSGLELHVFPNPLMLLNAGGGRLEPQMLGEDFRHFYNINQERGIAFVLEVLAPIDPSKQHGTVKIVDGLKNAITDINMSFVLTARGTIAGIAVWDGRNMRGGGEVVGTGLYSALIEFALTFDYGHQEVRTFYRPILVTDNDQWQGLFGISDKWIKTLDDITDTNFMAALAEQVNYGYITPSRWNIAEQRIEATGEEVLVISGEVSDITHLDLSNRDIENLNGIENFTSLVYLNVSGNRLTGLNLSSNSALEYLDVSRNFLNSRNDVVGIANEKFDEINFIFGQQRDRTPQDITNKFTDPAFLAKIYALINKIAPARILISDVDTITTLIIPAGKTRSEDLLIRELNGIQYLISLKFLDVSGHEIRELDLPNNPKIEHLDVSGNQLTRINITHNIALKFLDVSENKLEMLDVSGNRALEELNASENQLTRIDLTHNINLKFLDVSENRLDSRNEILGIKTDVVVIDHSQTPLPCVSFDSLVIIRFGTTMAVINNPRNSYKGYLFDEFEWYRDGKLIGHAQSYYAGPDGIPASGKYHVVAMNRNVRVRSCIYTHSISQNTRQHSELIKRGERFYMDANMDESLLVGAEIVVFNTVGNVIARVKVNGRITELDPRLASGHLFKLVGKNGLNRILRKVTVE